MKRWLPRGIVLTALHVVVRTVIGVALVSWPLQGSVFRILGLVVVVVAALVWGAWDGRADRLAHPDPDQSSDLTVLWLKAAAVTGLLGGFLTWLIDAVTPLSLGIRSLFFELTSGAAFTVLMVFVPAVLGVFVGRFLTARRHRDAFVVPSHDHTADTEARRRELASVGAAGTPDGSRATHHGDETAHPYSQYPDDTYADEAYPEGGYADDTPTGAIDLSKQHGSDWQEPRRDA